jgi:DNA-binding MarR family transcriptional regulator
VRSTGNHIYKEAVGLKETELRLVITLGRMGPLTHVQLVNSIGHGKPQVSRATRDLMAAGILVHQTHRAPFELTEKGEAIYQTVAAIAEKRSEILVSGMSADDLSFLSTIIARLTKLGEHWLAEERSLSADASAFPDEPSMPRAPGDIASDDMLLSSLITMSVLVQRSALLMWRRTVGISPFDWIVLSRVAEHGELKMGELVLLTGRDKAQVSRTVKGLIEDGLLARIEPEGKREIVLVATEKGDDVYQQTARNADLRERVAAAALGEVNKARLEYLIERMIANTEQME